MLDAVLRIQPFHSGLFSTRHQIVLTLHCCSPFRSSRSFGVGPIRDGHRFWVRGKTARRWQRVFSLRLCWVGSMVGTMASHKHRRRDNKRNKDGNNNNKNNNNLNNHNNNNHNNPRRPRRRRQRQRQPRQQPQQQPQQSPQRHQ